MSPLLCCQLTLLVMLLVVNALPLYCCNPASVLLYLINHLIILFDFAIFYVSRHFNTVTCAEPTTMRNKLSIILLLAIVLSIILLLFIHKRGRNVSTFQNPADPPFDFVPAAMKNFYECEDLFGPDTTAAGFKMSHDFYAGFSAFEAIVKKATARVKLTGHTGKMGTLYKALHYLASRTNVRNICETGFYFGYSSYNYLTANRHAIVHSFDLGIGRSMMVASFLRNRFGSRFSMHKGDSKQVVPEFTRMNPDHRCDFILVDGGHHYAEAMADLLNMAAMANVDAGNIIVLDDYPSLVPFAQTGWAWENMRRWGYVKELMRCLFTKHKLKPNRGFVVGTVVRRPVLPV